MQATIIESAAIRGTHDELRRCTVDMTDATLIRTAYRRRKDGSTAIDNARNRYRCWLMLADGDRREISQATYDALQRLMQRMAMDADDGVNTQDVCLNKVDGYVTSGDVWTVSDVWHTGDVRMLARSESGIDRVRSSASYAGVQVVVGAMIRDDRGLLVQTVDVYADDDDAPPTEQRAVLISSGLSVADTQRLLSDTPVSVLLRLARRQ